MGVDGGVITDSGLGLVAFLPFRATTKRGENLSESPYCKYPNRFLSLLSFHVQGHAYLSLVSSVHFALTDSGATARLFVQIVSYFNTSPSCVRSVQYQSSSPVLFDGPSRKPRDRKNRCHRALRDGQARASPCTQPPPNLSTPLTPASRTHTISSTGRSPSSNRAPAFSQL
jgi:hypothetical protein